MNIPKELSDDIWEFCRLNDITNIDEFKLKLLKQGYTMEKYGATPQTIEKIVEVEKIIEKTIEVPIEKVVEVQVEKIVEKNVYISDDTKITELTSKLTSIEDDKRNLESQIDGYVSEIEKLKNDISELNKKIEAEKGKNKRDIYGE
jgi:predicted RNase H-like nuclease (RuvC/YqgF family)